MRIIGFSGLTRRARSLTSHFISFGPHEGGSSMKKIVLCLLTVPLFLPLIAAGQNQSNIGKAFTVSGKVSPDGKSLVPANGESWSVVNPAALAGHEGRQVEVKCRLS